MTGSVLMTDGTGAPGPYTQTPYKLVTTDIESVSGSAPAITLTFPGAVSTNPDLQYFQAGDVVQTTPDEVKVLSTGYPDSNTMVVDGGEWLSDAEIANQNRDQVWTDGLSVSASKPIPIHNF